MIPNYQNREIETSGIEATREFGISLNDSAHIMTMLRDTLYSDKVLAVIREYSANAWDSHKEAGRADVPIKVMMPTNMEPTLIIEDFGVGISHEDVFTIYTQYGASTKRGNNESVGQLGIGSKSGFAYSDSFTIVSSHGGIRSTYVALLDKSEKGGINLLFQEACGEATGVAIHIPVRPEDIPEFNTKARQLFQYFHPRPDINIDLPVEPPAERRMKNGIIWSEHAGKSGEWLALMGCIPYKVNLSQLIKTVGDDKRDRSGLGQWISKLSGVLYFRIGEVHVSASREELKYTTSTKERLVAKLNDLVDEFVMETLTTIESENISNWERRLRLQILSRLSMPVPEGYSEMVKGHVSIPDDFIDPKHPKLFQIMHRGGTPVKHLDVSTDTKLLLQDDSRKIDGFDLSRCDYLVAPRQMTIPDALNPKGTYADWDLLKAELATWISKTLIDGIPIAKLSNEVWTPPYVKPKKIRAEKNAKHHLKRFVMVSNRHSTPYSQNWDAAGVTTIPKPDDVFVILNSFQTTEEHNGSKFDIYSTWNQDKSLAETFKVTLPTVFGYKTTKAKPLLVKDCAGIHYPLWREKFHEQLAAMPEVQKDLSIYDWQRYFKSKYQYNQPNTKKVIEGIGKDHPLCQFLIKLRRSYKKWNTVKGTRSQGIRSLFEMVYTNSLKKPESDVVRDEICARYPLLGLQNIGIEALWDTSSRHWLEYVQLVDRAAPLNLIKFTPVPDSEKEDIDDDYC